MSYFTSNMRCAAPCHACVKRFNIKAYPGSNLPLSACMMLVCPDCGDKRCAKAMDHHNPCSTPKRAPSPWPFRASDDTDTVADLAQAAVDIAEAVVPPVDDSPPFSSDGGGDFSGGGAGGDF